MMRTITQFPIDLPLYFTGMANLGKGHARNDKPRVFMIFDPLGTKGFHPGLLEGIESAGIDLVHVPVHMIKGSLRYGEYFLVMGKHLEKTIGSSDDQFYHRGLEYPEYIFYLETGLAVDLAQCSLPKETAAILMNTARYRALFLPGDMPEPPYLLWKDGCAIAGRPAYLATGERGSFPGCARPGTAIFNDCRLDPRPLG
jgi:hypothetical protein